MPRLTHLHPPLGKATLLAQYLRLCNNSSPQFCHWMSLVVLAAPFGRKSDPPVALPHARSSPILGPPKETMAQPCMCCYQVFPRFSGPLSPLKRKVFGSPA